MSLRGAIRAVAGTVLIVSAFMDLTSRLRFGQFSGQALVTIAYFFAVSILLPLVQVRNSGLLSKTIPLVLFAIFAALSLTWTTTISNGFQNVIVVTTFVLIVYVASIVAYHEPDFAFWVERRLRYSSLIASAIYTASLVIFGRGADDIVSARCFGLFALFGVAQLLAYWRYGSKLGLLGAISITLLIAASESRLALGAAVALFPLAQIPTERYIRVVKMIGVLIVVAGLSYAALDYFDTLRERFLTGDVSLRIGSLVINGSGRTNFWRLTLESIQENPIMGSGAGSAEGLIQAVYGDVRHPHNDYLRVLHDYGIIGLTLWVCGIAVLLVNLWRGWKYWDAQSASVARIYLAALLCLLAFVFVMTADNSMVYIFVTAPLALVVGSALGFRRLPVFSYDTDPPVWSRDGEPHRVDV